MSELEKAARKCVFDELCVWCCKRVYTHCEYRAETKDEPICKEGKVVHAKFIAGAEWQAKQSPWISVKDQLPEVGTDVLVFTKNRKVTVSSMYIPTDCKENVLGDKEWKGSGQFKDSIIAWMFIPSFDDIFKANKDVLQRIKEKGD